MICRSACSILSAIILLRQTASYTPKRPAMLWYTAEKDPDTEAALEKSLTAAGIFYSKSDEIYIDEEQMFYVIYEIEV